MRRTCQRRSFPLPHQAETARTRSTAGARAVLLGAVLVLAGCVNSNLLDPPAFFETTASTMLSVDCGGGKGTPENVVLCADVNTTTGDPITFTFYIPTSNTAVALVVYDVHGTVVARLADQTVESPSWQSAVWDLRDTNGDFVPAGNYRVFLKVGGQTSEQGDVTIY